MQKDEFRGSGKDYENNADGLDKWITQIAGGESSNKIVPQKKFSQKPIPVPQKNASSYCIASFNVIGFSWI